MQAKRRDKESYREISVLDPKLCQTCRFAHIATLRYRNGDIREAPYCSRLDCDNWVTSRPADVNL